MAKLKEEGRYGEPTEMSFNFSTHPEFDNPTSTPFGEFGILIPQGNSTADIPTIGIRKEEENKTITMDWIDTFKQQPPTNTQIWAKHPVHGTALLGKAYKFGKEWRIKHADGDVPFYKWCNVEAIG